MEGLVDVVMAGQPVCPQGEEWGLDLKNSKTKYNSLCNWDSCETATSHVIACTYIGMH